MNPGAIVVSILKSETIKMSCNYQTKLMKWQPLADAQNPIFSVYRTETALEIRSGCEEQKNARLICTQNSYEGAHEFCELLAQQTGLLIQDCTLDHPN